MRFVRNILTVVLLSLLLQARTAVAMTADSLRLEQLQKEVYRHYSKHNTEEFLRTSKQLMALAKELGAERYYYKALGNEAVYASAYINRGEAVEMAKALYREAEQEHSLFGLYTANHVLGTIYTGLNLIDEARSHYRDALNIPSSTVRRKMGR